MKIFVTYNNLIDLKVYIYTLFDVICRRNFQTNLRNNHLFTKQTLLDIFTFEVDLQYFYTSTNNINTSCLFIRYKEMRAAEKAEEQRLEEHERRRREEAVSYSL